MPVASQHVLSASPATQNWLPRLADALDVIHRVEVRVFSSVLLLFRMTAMEGKAGEMAPMTLSCQQLPHTSASHRATVPLNASSSVITKYMQTQWLIESCLFLNSLVTSP
jgi:hypothetical protein